MKTLRHYVQLASKEADRKGCYELTKRTQMMFLFVQSKLEEKAIKQLQIN